MSETEVVCQAGETSSLTENKQTDEKTHDNINMIINNKQIKK